MWMCRIPFLFCMFTACTLPSNAPAGDEIQPASQIGPSCAFFGNIPALTLHTGVDISNATEFIRPIYGLHRGDFKFQSSFDKHKFFELFSIPYSRTEIKHPRLPRHELVLRIREIISTRIDPALDDGRIFSLRCVGAFGGPHNVLLLGRNDGRYRIHDSFPGVIRTLDRKALAEMLLVRSSASKRLPQAEYVTHFLELTIPDKKSRDPLTPAKLPSTLEVELDPGHRARIARSFRLTDPQPENSSLSSRIAHFKELDFAALPPRREGKEPVNAASDKLTAKELLGLVRLSQFTLCVWNLRHRDLLPVVFIDGRPQVLSSYRTAANREVSLVFDDGKTTVEYNLLDALERIKKDGAMYATIVIPQDG